MVNFVVRPPSGSFHGAVALRANALAQVEPLGSGEVDVGVEDLVGLTVRRHSLAPVLQ